VHYYLVPYTGDGTEADPFRPDVPDGVEWTSIDLRSDATTAVGDCLVATPNALPFSLQRVHLGNELGVLPLPARLAVSTRLGVDLVGTTTVRDMVRRLLVEYGGPGMWKPLSPGSGALFRISLGGEVIDEFSA
jgi:hypothetical protein